jgi:transposase-like protein
MKGAQCDSFPGLDITDETDRARLADDPQHFPGQGQMKPERLEIARLKREVLRLKAERDILRKAAAYFSKELT